jgi:hypothetical protein
MALSDILPDRPLTDTELEDLQQSDAFDEIDAADESGRIDSLTITVDGTEHHLHYAPGAGWHKHEGSHSHH